MQILHGILQGQWLYPKELPLAVPKRTATGWMSGCRPELFPHKELLQICFENLRNKRLQATPAPPRLRLLHRLESFDKSELVQFSTLAVTQDIYKAADFINLTFCFQSYPIVQDFANLERIGQNCFMDRNGGTMSLGDEQHINFKK